MVACGAVFGLTAAVVFCGVVGVANHTFLKTEQTAVETAAGTESKVESTVTATAMPTTDSKVEGELTVSEIAQNCMPSIVSITNKSVSEVRSLFGTQEYESVSCGSGIVIGQNDTELLIATNNHVVEDANSLSVCFGDSEEAVYEAQIKGTKADNDLAIVSVKLADMDQDVLSTVKIATIGSSSELKIGEGVIAIGNALGYGQSVTTGIVSALDREVTIDNLSAKLIQTDAAINPGNSGGALLNMKGELIGINSAKFASSEVEGMGYAIPIDTAQPILEELMMRETRDKLDVNESGFLGINCQNVDKDVSEMYGIPEGVYVLSVTKGSAADNAGIQKGDIITDFDGVSISSREELKNTLLYYSPGETVEVTIQRSNNGGYEESKVTVTLDQNTVDGTTDETQSDDSYYNNYGSSDQYNNGLEDFFHKFYGN
jgi:serine protease Do